MRVCANGRMRSFAMIHRRDCVDQVFDVLFANLKLRRIAHHEHSCASAGFAKLDDQNWFLEVLVREDFADEVISAFVAATADSRPYSKAEFAEITKLNQKRMYRLGLSGMEAENPEAEQAQVTQARP